MRALAMDFQPVFMAGHSLQSHDRSLWERKVRPSVVPKDQPQCVLCGFVALEKRGLIHADEVWSFPGPPHVVLIAVRPLCTRCHDAKDFAHLLDRINAGKAPKRRAAEILDHYCVTNGCSEYEFRNDIDTAVAKKRALESLYNPNCQVVVDYGQWGRPSDKPRLTMEQQKALRRLEFHDEPIFIAGRKFTSYRSAIKTIQSISLDQRDAVIEELRSMLSEDQDDDALTERDEGVQFS